MSMFNFFPDSMNDPESIIDKKVTSTGTFYKVRNGFYDEYYVNEKEIEEKFPDLLVVFEACKKRDRSSPQKSMEKMEREKSPIRKKRKTTVFVFRTTAVPLMNLGNTCYLNSSLQVLFSCKNVCRSILGGKCHPGSFAFMLQNLLRGMITNPQVCTSPKSLADSIRGTFDNIGRSMGRSQQHDAQDCLRHIIGKSMLEKTCQVQMSSIVRCSKCLSVKETKFFETDISVPINYEAVEHCIEDYFRVERLSGSNQYSCSNCGMRVDALKKLRIDRFPDVLFIHTKRFGVNMRTFRSFKVNNKISLCDKLEFSGNKETYELVGVICHTGSQEKGHYTSYVRKLNVSLGSNRGGREQDHNLRFKRDGLFTKIDDLVISEPVPMSSISKFSPYIIVYEKAARV